MIKWDENSGKLSVSTNKDNLPSESVYERFKRGWEELGLTMEELDEWEYCGGDFGHHLVYYKAKFPNRPFPEHEWFCICKKDIKKNIYITNKKRDTVLVIGCDCGEHFIPGGVKKKRCVQCGEPTRNRKDNLCNHCRGYNKQASFGKYRHQNYGWIVENDEKYIQWLVNELRRRPGYHCRVFLEWIKEYYDVDD